MSLPRHRFDVELVAPHSHLHFPDYHKV